MKVLNYAFVILLAVVLISQMCIVAFGNDEPITWNEPQSRQSNYGLYGDCIDITPIIADIETVNGIECFCIVYEGQVIYVPSK